MNCSIDHVQSVWQSNQTKAIDIAGGVEDFESRINGYLDLYYDSDRKFLFPLVALHGAQWADHYFSRANLKLTLLRMNILGVLFHKKLKKAQRLAQGLKAINREVFIDVYSKYRTFLDLPDCLATFERLGIPKKLLGLLKRMHLRTYLRGGEKLELYKASLEYEQKINVAPRIERLAKALKLSDLDKRLFLRPRVRFPYFPQRISFKFKNFFSTQERIHYATEAAIIGLKVGEDRLLSSLE